MKILTALLFIILGILIARWWKSGDNEDETRKKEFLSDRANKPHPYDYIKTH